MKIKNKILSGFLVICIVGFYFFLDTILNDIRPMYLESIEESLNDTANLLATIIEYNLDNENIKTSDLQEIFKKLPKKKLQSKIFAFKKSHVDINIYVTNNKGIVIYDSLNPGNAGKNFSRWNDVYLTLKGKYGARSSALNPEDPDSRAVFVAAPIKYKNKIIGSVTIIKPKQSVSFFVALSKRKIIYASLITFIIFILLSFILSHWINIPIIKLTRFVNSLSTQKNAKLPRLSSPEMKELGMAFDNIFQELEGKKYIENYIQTLTHEIKSPLTSIIAASELLNENNMPDDQRMVFNSNVLHESRRIEKIIQRLLLLSSLENKQILDNVEEFNLSNIINSSINSFNSQLQNRKISLEKNINENILFSGNKFLIQQVIDNLFQNAINFSKENSTIKLILDQKDNRTFIKIIDEGTGIPGYAINKIFDKFYSLPSYKTNKKSSGLGLPFVKEVIELHNGSIKIYNNLNSGVTAEINF